MSVTRVPSCRLSACGIGSLLLAAAVLAGCASAASRTTSPTAPPSASASPVPAALASPSPLVTAAPTGSPSAGPTTSPSAGPPGLLPAYFLAWKPGYSPKDAHGVVLMDYGADHGVQYQPTTIASAAIGYYNRWLTDTDPAQTAADKAAFLTQTDWLIAHQTNDGRWLFTFSWGSQPVPWWSAMTEGVGMSALLRAYAMTGDPAARVAVELARTTFDRDLDHLGVGAQVSLGDTSYVVYQEYLRGYEENVLNGWIFSLVGLYEASIYLQDPRAAQALWDPDRGIAAVRALLPYYDTGSWSRYDMVNPGPAVRGSLDTSAYHSLVISQLRYLGAITGDPFFTGYAERFQSYERS